MRKIANRQYAELLYQLIQETEQKDFKKILAGFVKLLYKNRDLRRSDKIIQKFREIYNQKEKVAEAELTTSHHLSKLTYDQIEKWLKLKLGKKIELTKKTDQEILGGLVLKFEDTIIDYSLKTKLTSLQKILLK